MQNEHKTTSKAVDDYIHDIDLEALKRETGLTIEQISEIANYRNPKCVYAWDKPKSQSGSRPSYNTFIRLLEAGASMYTLFGIGDPPEPPGPSMSDDEIERGVLRVLSRLVSKAGQAKG